MGLWKGRANWVTRVLAVVMVVCVGLVGAVIAVAAVGGPAAPHRPAVRVGTGPQAWLELAAGNTAAPAPIPVATPAAPPAATPVAAAPPAKRRHAHAKPDSAYYRRTATEHVDAAAGSGFLPLYREAERTFGVSWRLIASVHRQETAFSTEPSTYHGLNAFGCCAGPMQFNVKNKPVSTWKRYAQSFRQGERPASYPHRTRFHPSVYDDFDAIMAAGALLRDDGAGMSLDGGSWLAAYGYYGHDDFGVTYADQVVGRAQGWAQTGFCLNCGLNESLVQQLEDAYGVDARKVLAAAAKAKKKKHHKKKAKKKPAAATPTTAAAGPARKPKTPKAPSGTTATPTAPAPTPVAPPAATTVPSGTTPPPTAATGPTGTTGPAPDCPALMQVMGCGSG